MSSFICEHCGTELIDTPTGYITECPHYPHDKLAVFVMDEVMHLGRKHPAEIKYPALEEKHMEPWQTRVVDEKNELDARIAKLVEFRTTEIFKQLPPDEQHRLHLQQFFMTCYTNVLADRISVFGLTTPVG